jgi:thioredoxin-like negative regulator of GroEL
MARFFLARSLIAAGDYADALEVLERMPVNRNQPPAITLRGYLMGRTGHADEARQVIRELRSSAEQAPDMSVQFDLAVVYLGLGDYEQTLEALELAAEHRDFRVRLLGEEPMFRELRGQPKFTALLQLAGLPVEPGRDAGDRL